jgi:hypothetical protein
MHRLLKQVSPRLWLLILLLSAIGLSTMAAPGFALPACPWDYNSNCTDYRDACESYAYGTCHLVYTYAGQCIDAGNNVLSLYHASCGSCYVTADCAI